MNPYKNVSRKKERKKKTFRKSAFSEFVENYVIVLSAIVILTQII